MDPNTAEMPLQNLVSSALLRIPRYNSFHQHNAIPSMPDNIYNHGPGAGPGSSTTSNNNHTSSVQPASTSVINLSNSSDVVIGPMTQYQGSVTIYQYMDATVEASRSATGRNSQIRGLPSPEHPSVNRRKQYFHCGALILFSIIAFCTALYFIIEYVQSDSSDSSQHPILFGPNYSSDTIPNLGNNHLVVYRNSWGGQEKARGKYPMFRPIPYVLVTHQGGHEIPCFDIYTCSIKMRILQGVAVSQLGLTDVASNFYLGGDGFIYVGRGWDIANAYANKTLTICFMGDYVRYEPKEKQFSALDHLLDHGVTNGYLVKDYKLVAHNQTKTTFRSPGPYIYERITKMPRWYPCGTEGYDRCGAEIGLPARWDFEKNPN